MNGLFSDLLKVSPFSKDEAKKYRELLDVRNVLVHHGGVYTLKYAEQKFAKAELRAKAHWDSIKVASGDVSTWVGFLHEIAKKSALASQRALTNFVRTQNVKMTQERHLALKLLSPG